MIAVADVVAVAGAVLVVHGTDSNVLHLHRSTLHSVGHFESVDPIDRVHEDRGEIAIDSNVSIHDDRVVNPNGGRHLFFSVAIKPQNFSNSDVSKKVFLRIYSDLVRRTFFRKRFSENFFGEIVRRKIP